MSEEAKKESVPDESLPGDVEAVLAYCDSDAEYRDFLEHIRTSGTQEDQNIIEGHHRYSDAVYALLERKAADQKQTHIWAVAQRARKTLSKKWQQSSPTPNRHE